jgi:hypothetical protein
MVDWLGASQRRPGAAFIRRAVLLGIGAAAVLWATIPADSVPINVRWHTDVTAEGREALERRFQLVEGQPVGGNTWRYNLLGYSRENIRALVTDAAVADTYYINRSTFEPEDPPVNRIVLLLAGSLLIAMLGAFALSKASVTLGPPGLALAAGGVPFVLFVLGILVLVTAGATSEWPWGNW